MFISLKMEPRNHGTAVPHTKAQGRDGRGLAAGEKVRALHRRKVVEVVVEGRRVEAGFERLRRRVLSASARMAQSTHSVLRRYDGPTHRPMMGPAVGPPEREARTAQHRASATDRGGAGARESQRAHGAERAAVIEQASAWRCYDDRLHLLSAPREEGVSNAAQAVSHGQGARGGGGGASAARRALAWAAGAGEERRPSVGVRAPLGVVGAWLDACSLCACALTKFGERIEPLNDQRFSTIVFSKI
jgi:hypothetical protein